MPPSSPPLADQADRDRFTKVLDCNFSVTAPAGVGKTTAIVSRVVELARTDQNREDPALPRLSVVTYTRKAADEMRRRSADALHEAKAGPEVFARFHQAFFGTIHSFCLELLRMFGPLAGLSPQFEQIGNEDVLWWEFLRGRDNLLQSLPDESRDSFARHASLSKVYGLVKEFGAQLPTPPPPGPAPKVDLASILTFQPSKRNLENIAIAQRMTEQWLETFQSAEAPCPPLSYDKGGKEFQEVWNDTWMPLKAWLGKAYLYLAAKLALEFRDFRVARGQINYNDMVALAAQLLEHPAVSPAIREQNRLIILDEAQDTDRLQFAVLLNVAGARWSPDEPLHTASGPPPGHYCQVGDPQQAIYGSRADLATYREVHDGLVALNAAEALSFTVTMRCDEAIVSAVNQFFPRILRPADQQGDQAEFVPLQARPDAGPGKVYRVTLPADPSLYEIEKPKADERAEAEARALARWIRETGHLGIGTSDWSQIAILAPRNAWIETLTNALDRENLPVQTHSRSESRASDPLWAWISALARVLAHPEDVFELAGVLREVFALPDDTIARYCLANRPEAPWVGGEHALSLPIDPQDESPIGKALKLLNQLRQDVQNLALGYTFRLISERLRLRERLTALPEQDEASIAVGLKRLQANALCAEEQGADLAEWSRQLILARDGDQETDDPKPGFIQLLSCHKAKGLQWHVVIVPSIHRDVKFAPTFYPRLFRATADTPAIVGFDKDCCKQLAEHKQQLDAQELERLAYVSWTRSRQRLILVDGAAFYEGMKPSGSWINLWNVAENGPNAQAWVNLPEFSPASPTLPVDPPKFDENESHEPLISLFSSVARVSSDINDHAQTFPKRILPSSLAQHAPWPDTEAMPEFLGHARDESDWRSEPGYPETRIGAEALGGADYGNWFHNIMEHGPWGQDNSVWVEHFAAAVPHCPIPERGPRELEALLTTAEFIWLNDDARLVRTEVPLFWPESSQAPAQAELDLTNPEIPPATFAYDGFIDLLAHDEERDQWRVVDWKTDRVGDQPAAELLQAYSPQLNAYVTALNTIFSRPVEGYLYSTRTAKWIRLPG